MLYLQELAKQGLQHKKLIINERLPVFLVGPCEVESAYQVEAKEDFYLLYLEVRGELNVICQRCLHEFSLVYNNPTTIAVTRSDERAEQLLTHYECIVSSNFQVNLEEIIIDELHLYVPQFHQEIEECDKGINQFLTEKTEL